jgi:broad specificity phosphatase PhoE
MVKVVMVRHGAIASDLLVSRTPVFAGARFDLLPLNPKGVRQIESLAVRLAPLDIQLALTSPYTRALHSCGILCRALDIPFQVEPDLRDWLPGPAESDWPSSEERDFRTKEYEKYVRSNKIPAGRVWEAPDEIRQRVTRVLDRHGELEAILVVTHELIIKILTGRDKVPLGSVTMMTWRRVGTLAR